jgi:hypothetical protein
MRSPSARMDGQAEARTDGTHEKEAVYGHYPLRGAQHEFTLSRKEWGICHRVPGKYYPH